MALVSLDLLQDREKTIDGVIGDFAIALLTVAGSLNGHHAQ